MPPTTPSTCGASWTCRPGRPRSASAVAAEFRPAAGPRRALAGAGPHRQPVLVVVHARGVADTVEPLAVRPEAPDEFPAEPDEHRRSRVIGWGPVPPVRVLPAEGPLGDARRAEASHRTGLAVVGPPPRPTAPASGTRRPPSG